jgi:predicted AlkP superfamily pyrophosphatase or phosphodiesterase
MVQVKSSRIVSLVILLMLLACAPGMGLAPLETATTPEVRASETPSPSPVPPMATVTSTPRPLAERVLIVSFDGLRPDAIGKAPMNNLIALMQTSAYTLSAQTILPSSTLPAHASMLSGMCPSKHGVYWNEYVPENGYALGTDLFDLAHAAGLRTVMVVGKEKLRQVTEPESTDVFILKEMDSSIANMAVEEIKNDFGLMFIHFPTGDVLGHEWGWMGGVQMWAFRTEDAYLGTILTALDKAGLRTTTLVIATADHGGYGHSHGGDRPEEMTIPWIISGPGVVPGPLTSFVQTTDTAATAAYLLGLPLPAEWDGVPVTEAFGQPTPPRVHAACQQTH